MAFGDLKGTLSGNGNSITASNSIAGSVVVAVGDLVFAVLGQQTNLTATGATDNLGNTYTAQNAGTDAGAATGRAFWSRVTVAGTLTSVAVAASSSNNDWAGFAAVITGPFVTSPLDTNPANTTAKLTSPFTCPATGTLAQATEAVLCWIASDGSAVWTATSPNLKAGQVANSTTIKVIIGYQAVHAITPVAPAFAGTNPTVDALGTCSFKALTQASTAPLFTDTETFYSATLTPGTPDLKPPLFTDTESFYSATFSLAMSPPLITDTESFFSATFTRGPVNLTAPLLTDAEALYSATLRPGSINLGTPIFSDAESFYSATLTPGSVNLGPPRFNDSESFYSAIFTPGPVNLGPPLFSDEEAFYIALVEPPKAMVAPTLTDSESFYDATFAPGAVGLAPPFFTEMETFYSATISGAHLLPPRFADPDIFYAPTFVSVGATLNLAPARYAAPATFYGLKFRGSPFPPNGRWRSVVDQSARYAVPDYNTILPVVGEVGFTIFFNTPVAQSNIIEDMELVFAKPSGAELRVQFGRFYSGVDPVAAALNLQHTFVAYTFGPGELDEPGMWTVYLARGSAQASGLGMLRVATTLN